MAGVDRLSSDSADDEIPGSSKPFWNRQRPDQAEIGLTTHRLKGIQKWGGTALLPTDEKFMKGMTDEKNNFDHANIAGWYRFGR
jgi:hypothetical protein